MQTPAGSGVERFMGTKAVRSLAREVPRSMDLSNVNLRTHVAQFYSSDTFFLNSLSAVIRPALRAGDTALVVATQAHREELGRRLKTAGVNVANLTKQGRYISLDAASTLAKFMVD